MSATTLLDVLAGHLDARPDHELYTFLDAAGREVDRLTVGETLARATALAARLRREGLATGDRVLLVFPPDGLEFVVGFFGVMLAGGVAVPVSSPDPRALARDLPTLRHIAVDCDAHLALTHSRYWALTRVLGARDRVRSLVGGLVGDRNQHEGETLEWPKLRWIFSERLGSASVEATRRALGRGRARTGPESLAFLQYTSGSTSRPKGVMVRQRNLMHNLALIARNTEVDADTVVVGWVPLYHDMGLTGGILNVAHVGARLVFFSPLSFLTNPGLWLEALSKYGGTHSGSPNFGYEYVLRAVEDPRTYDLSRWRGALQGGEPMRAATVERFAAALDGSGFEPRALTNIYGMAETVLFVSGRVGEAIAELHVDPYALERERVIELVPAGRGLTLLGCGRPDTELGVELRVVDPETGVAVPGRGVGEIWLASPSNADGYWRWTEADNDARFRARIVDEPDAGPYLRTGDLGFIHEGELYLCGRLADLMIFAGRNVHPEDVEAALREAHPLLRRGGVAVFAAPGDAARGPGDAGLCVVAELRRARAPDVDLDAVVDAILDRVHAELQLPCSGVALLEAGALAKTTSGKVRRGACRAAWAAGALTGELLRRTVETELGVGRREALAALDDDARRVEVRAEVRAIFARALGRRQLGDRASSQPLVELGIDSLTMLELRNRLANAFELPLPATFALALEHPSVDALAEHIAARLAAGPTNFAGPRRGSARALAKVAGQPLRLNRELDATPLLLIHPGSGGVEVYLELARALDGEVTVYAVQAPGVDGRERPLDKLDAFVARYLDGLGSLAAGRPWMIGGYSAGGVVAYELANELHARGLPVASVALIDALSFVPFADEGHRYRRQLLGADVLCFCRGVAREMGLPVSFELEAARVRELPPSDAWSFVARVLAEAQLPLGVDDLQQRLEVLRSFAIAFAHYQPQRFEGRVLLLRAGTPTADILGLSRETLAAHMDAQPDYGWGTFADELELQILPGDHFGLLAASRAKIATALVAEASRAASS